MEQRERTMKKGATKVTAIALAIAAVMALALCGCASQGDTSKSDIPAEDRTNAKQVIMAAGDLFTMMAPGPHRCRQPRYHLPERSRLRGILERASPIQKGCRPRCAECRDRHRHHRCRGCHSTRGQHSDELPLRHKERHHDRQRQDDYLRCLQGLLGITVTQYPETYRGEHYGKPVS